MIKIVVSGASGRMGQRIIRLAQEDRGIKLVGALEAPGHASLGQSVGDALKISDNLEDMIQGADVLIEFTNPQATLAHLRIAVKNGLPMVIGTTGFNEKDEKTLLEHAGKIPCVYSSNMSLGVNLLFKLTAQAAEVLKEYDREIVEAHHNKKKDAPSGTAKSLADILKSRDNVLVYGREGLTGPRPGKEIGIHSIRGGDIVGEHTVLFIGTGERLELTHRAQSRDTLAAGALKAAGWVVNKQKGCYSMKDVLGL